MRNSGLKQTASQLHLDLSRITRHIYEKGLCQVMLSEAREDLGEDQNGRSWMQEL